MAHDKQYKDTILGVQIKRFDYPQRGEWYWDRYRHRVVQAGRNVNEKFCIVDRGN